MISFNEMLHGHMINDVPDNVQHAMEDFLVKINKLRDAWGKPMIVTSGYRDAADQARINPKVTQSKHMTGHAIDILDTDASLWQWVNNDGLQCLVDNGLYCEERQGVWVHFQDQAPVSGRRFFEP